MEERDLRILHHVGLYRITLRPVLERLFFAGTSCGNVVQRLRQHGYLRTGKLPGNISYYQLTPSAATTIGLPVSRGTVFRAQALQQHLSILYFCCMQDTRRYRIENEQLSQSFQEHPPQGDHCIEETPNRKRLYHLYVPAPNTSIRNIIREIRHDFRQAIANSGVRPWIAGRMYAFAVLVDTPQRRSTVREQLKTTLEGTAPLIKYAYFCVETVPGYRTIHTMFKRKGET